MLSTTAFLGALLLFSHALGPVSPAACRAGGILCLGLGWLASGVGAARAARPVRNGRLVLSLLLLALSLLLILGAEQRLVGLAAVCLNLCALALLTERKQSRAGAAQALCGAAVVYFALVFLVQYWPRAWWLIDYLCCGLSAWAGRQFGTGVVQGATTSGMYVFALVLAWLVCRTFATRPRRWELLLLGSGVLALFFFVQVAYGPVYAVGLTRKLFRLLASNAQTGLILQWERARSAAHAAGLLFLASCLWLVLLEFLWSRPAASFNPFNSFNSFNSSDPLAAAPPPRTSARPCASRWLPHVSLAACLLVSGLGTALLLRPRFETATQARAGGRVLFDRQPGETLRDFSTVPDFHRFGLVNAGMFGLLPRYLSAWGYTPVMRGTNDALDAKLLAGADVFVVINPERPFAAAEHDAIWQFVRTGGALLVLGDHTDIGGSMKPLNRLLEPAGVRFNFDCAMTPTLWVNAYETFPHVIARGLDLGDEKLRHGTGASISLAAGVTPIISAKWGFSDAGDRNNKARAYLGDYRYEFHERLGDVVVIAEVVCGQGKALVFGDTTAFQSFSLAHAHLFIQGVFRHLVFDRPRNAAAATWGAALWLGALGLAAFAARFAGVPLASLALLAPFLTLNLAGTRSTAPLFRRDDRDAVERVPISVSNSTPAQAFPLACLDATHINLFSLEPWKDDAIEGLLNNLARNGFLPEVLHVGDWDKLRQSKVMVVIAPCRPYQPAEIRQLHEFMQGGGLLLLSVGYEEKGPAMALLQSLQMDIGDMPLGPVPIESPLDDAAAFQAMMRKPHFRKAWPLRNTGAAAGFESLYRAWDYDVAAWRQIGAGGAVVIADSLFLQDKMLENENAGWEGNINFLRSVFEHWRKKGGGK